MKLNCLGQFFFNYAAARNVMGQRDSARRSAPRFDRRGDRGTQVRIDRSP
jgi:hypothetical protein